jgi:hypothetical protein
MPEAKNILCLFLFREKACKKSFSPMTKKILQLQHQPKDKPTDIKNFSALRLLLEMQL